MSDTVRMAVILVAAAAFCATVCGGLFALQLGGRRHLIAGFSAGAVLGVAFFDLLPEALELGAGYSATATIGMAAIGFLAYLLLDRLILLHMFEESKTDTARGTLGASSLSLHSFLDGIGMGLAFKVSPGVGAIVAAAVLTHDFSDGINTVNFILTHKGEKARAFRWLLVDAMAPVGGVIATLFVTIPPNQLGLLLALFSFSISEPAFSSRRAIASIPLSRQPS